MIRVEYGPEGGDQLDLVTVNEIILLPASLPLTSVEGATSTVKDLLLDLDLIETYEDGYHTVWGILRREETAL